VSDAPTRTRFEPPIGPDSGPFWEATREGRFLLQWCTACARAVFYPRAFCPHCADGTEAVGAAFSGGQPFSVALIDLEEGVRMLSNVVGCPPEAVHCGMAVVVAWEPLSDGRQLPLFRPAGGGA
jgi:uncharacterized protein